jgi:SAM-dependent methyltransferase
LADISTEASQPQIVPYTLSERRNRLLGNTNVGQGLGIEVGALHSPTVSRAEGRMLYVDYAPTETLRANFKHPGVDPAQIVDVDIVWGERPLAEAIPEPADFIIASHVGEHVPDLIGWLLELHAALKPGGVLGLALPDRRFTFDVDRQESGVAEFVEAYLLGYKRPSLRHVFEAAALSRTEMPPNTVPTRRNTSGLPAGVIARLPEIYRWVTHLAREPAYVDAHCWVFTSSSFHDVVEGLAAIGGFLYVIDGFFPTEPGAIEFQVRLRSCRDSADPAIAVSIAEARRRLPAVFIRSPSIRSTWLTWNGASRTWRPGRSVQSGYQLSRIASSTSLRCQ